MIEYQNELVGVHPDVAIKSAFINEESIAELQMELGRDEIKNLKNSNDFIDFGTGKQHLKL